MNGTYRMLLFGASPLGALAGGALGSVAGLRPAMVIAALAMLSPTAWIPFSPVFRLKEMPAGPDDNAGTEEERSQAAELIEPGRKTDDVTEIIAVGRRPVLAGWEKSRRSGPGELPAEFTGGRPAALPDRQLLELRALLIGNSPRQLGFAPALWTREIIGELIRRRFGVILSGVTVGRILREQGMYPQGPLYRVYQQNTGKAREWREKTYPEIREEAARRGAEVFFADESPAEPPREPFACTDFRSVTTWGLTGPMPVVTATGERKPIMMVSAISSREELRFHLHEGTFRPADFIDFCRQLMQDIERDIFLIVEGISVHTSGETRAFVRSTGGKLRLFFLPAYSPELSPGGRARKNVMYDAIGRFDVRRADDPRAVALRAPKAAAETCVPIDSQDEY
jgi:transposase